MEESTLPPPNVGDDIYIPTAGFISHGLDDRVGGLAKVTSTYPNRSAGKDVTFITVEEIPGTGFNWEHHLAGLQDKLKAEFGDKRAHLDPDERPEFNEP